MDPRGSRGLVKPRSALALVNRQDNRHIQNALRQIRGPWFLKKLLVDFSVLARFGIGISRNARAASQLTAAKPYFFLFALAAAREIAHNAAPPKARTGSKY